jgi:hypothetical protein
MADGRLFTDYRPTCDLNPPIPVTTTATKDPGVFGGFDRRQKMMDHGQNLRAEDRMFTTLTAGTRGRIDTMVPEMNKRLCTWEGCLTLPAHPVGLGTGRMTLPGSPELVAGDPDILAVKATPGLFDTFSSHLKGSHENRRQVENRGKNRYSAPYGYY